MDATGQPDTPRSHAMLDERSLELHRLVAAKLRRQPDLLDRARATLGRWRVIVAPQSQYYVAAWQEVVDRGLEATLEAMLDPTEHGKAMRQCSPFAGVLDRHERNAFFRQWRSVDAPART